MAQEEYMQEGYHTMPDGTMMADSEHQMMDVPEGGIASFASADYGEMADMGRAGDDTLAHLQSGELVIPKELIDSDPELKEGIFQRMMDMGIDNPEQYVVGSDANSINPNTSLAEFGFFSKVFKKVKNVVKKVVNVVKKVLPVVLPIALSFTPLGPIYGAALGSGIGTLIQGGSIKDAFKSALISGGIGAMTTGFTGAGSFGDNVSNALSNPAARFSSTVSGAGESFGNMGKIFTGEAGVGETFVGEGKLFNPNYVSPDMQAAKDAASLDKIYADQTAKDLASVGIDKVPSLEVTPTTDAVTTQQINQQAMGPVNQVGVAAGKPGTFVEQPGFFEKAGDFLTGGDTSLGDVFTTQSQMYDASGNLITNPTAADYLQATKPGVDLTSVSDAGLKLAEGAVSANAPSMLATYGPFGALGVAGLAAAGGFEEKPMEELGIASTETGEDYVARDPNKYKVGDLGDMVLDPVTGKYIPRVNTGAAASSTNPYAVATNYQFSYNPYTKSAPAGPFVRPVTAAEGGAIYPRRYGGIMPDEGIQGQDSVRAMLMPGEFVMTTDAVRGAGNGNLNNGIRNMYSVMRDLEARGRS